MSGKQRLSATVDEEVLIAAQAAVSSGRATNISTWVNEAMHRHAEHERRMLALDAFVATYEAQHGQISDDEIRDANRRARERALVVRGERRVAAERTKRRRTGRSR